MIDERAVIEWAIKVVALDEEIKECNRALDDMNFEPYKWNWIELKTKFFERTEKILEIDETRMTVLFLQMFHQKLTVHKQSLTEQMTTLLNHDLNTARTERE